LPFGENEGMVALNRSARRRELHAHLSSLPGPEQPTKRYRLGSKPAEAAERAQVSLTVAVGDGHPDVEAAQSAAPLLDHQSVQSPKLMAALSPTFPTRIPKPRVADPAIAGDAEKAPMTSQSVKPRWLATVQSLRLGPHARLMAGGNRARFLGGMSVGAVHTWVDLDYPAVSAQNGVLIERGTLHRDSNGIGQFVGFDLGAEFNPGDLLLLGVAFDLFVDGTSKLSGDPFGDTALGYFGMSIRLGCHDWAAR
jgi:hypothetical protein